MEKYNPYEDLDISENEIQEIIKIYESFSVKQKNIFGFFLLYDLNAETIAEFYECSATYVSIKLMQSIRAYEQKHIDPEHIKLVLEIYVTTIQTKSSLNPILFRGNFMIGFIRKSIRKLQKFHPVEQVVIIICIMIFCYSSVITGQAIYNFGLVQMQHEKSADIYVSQSNENQLEFVETLYLPEYLPKGYKLLEQNGTLHKDSFVITIYTSDDCEILLQQNIDTIIMDFDNEDVKSKNIFVAGDEGIYQEKENLKKLIWSDNNYFYSLQIIGSNMTEQEFFKIANSIKEIRNEKK